MIGGVSGSGWDGPYIIFWVVVSVLFLLWLLGVYFWFKQPEPRSEFFGFILFLPVGLIGVVAPCVVLYCFRGFVFMEKSISFRLKSKS